MMLQPNARSANDRNKGENMLTQLSTTKYRRKKKTGNRHKQTWASQTQNNYLVEEIEWKHIFCTDLVFNIPECAVYVCARAEQTTNENAVECFR